MPVSGFLTEFVGFDEFPVLQIADNLRFATFTKEAYPILELYVPF